MKAPSRAAPLTERSPAEARTRLVVALVFGLLAAVSGALPSFSLGANLLVVGVGGVLLWIGMIRPAGAGGAAVDPLPPTARWWMAPVAGVLALEAVALVFGSTYDYPSLSSLTDPWLERYPVRAGAFLGWAAAFWAMARR